MSVKEDRRGSKVSTASSSEFSKRLVIFTAFIFLFAIADLKISVIYGYDVSSYATQLIITSGALFGATVVFYLNKAKIENLSKGKIRFLLLKLRLEIKLKDKLPPEHFDTIIAEIDNIEAMMDSKLNGALEEAIQAEIDYKEVM